MPPAAGDNVYVSDVNLPQQWSNGKPLVRLVQAVAQPLADATNVALTFTTEELDTHGFHDPVTNNSRITPNVAGWYTFRGGGFAAAMTTPVSLSVWLRKNGGPNGVAPAGRTGGAAGANSAHTSALIFCNGTTDYVELVVNQDSAGAINTNVSFHFSSAFECIGERPA